MKTLSISGENYEAEKVVKTEDSIIGYMGAVEIFSFQGISDFSEIRLSEEWDEQDSILGKTNVETQDLESRIVELEKKMELIARNK